MTLRRVRVIDTHTGGEPTRVVVAGCPDLGGGDFAERRVVFAREHDAFRSAVVNEPRGSDVMVGALLLPPVDPTCAAGVIFFNNVGTLGMCGHGTIGVAVALGYLGRIGAGTHRLETPVGIIAFDYDGDSGVSLENVPSYRHSQAVVRLDEGEFAGDVAWGGNWFFLVREHRLDVTHANVARLTDLAARIRHALPRQGITGDNGAEIDHVELFGPPTVAGADSKNFVLCPGLAYDRSPCGTGTSAKVACLAANGKLPPGQTYRQESIIGSVFEASYRVDGTRIIPRIAGTAYVNGEATLLLDPRDPFAWGIRGMKRVVVVGGGVVGVACAYYLRAAGLDVTLIDKGEVGQGCSHANCGYVCPSHALPLAGPGVIGKTLRTFLQKDSPLLIRPRFDPALWAWFLRFALRCSRGAMLEAGKGISALLNSSRSLYDTLLSSNVIDAEWQTKGLLFVFRTPAEMHHYAATDRLLRHHFDLAATPYDGEQLCKLEPALRPGLAGAWHYENDAHLRPDLLMTSWRGVIEAMGVTVREHCPLDALAFQGRRVRAVVTPQGPIAADAVVIATGAWTAQLAKAIGCALPIQPGKGYSITMARPSKCPSIPLIFEEDRVAVTPMNAAYRIGSTMEFAGFDERLDESRLDILRRAARVYLHEPEASPVLERWWGWRPMVPDGLPIVGAAPGRANLYLATGHGMLGLSMAPGTGKLLAELLTGATPHVDPRPYRAGRF